MLDALLNRPAFADPTFGALRGADRSLTLYAPDTGKEIRQVKAPPNPNQGVRFAVYGGTAPLAIAPDGKTLAVAEMVFDNMATRHFLKLYETATGKRAKFVRSCLS